jgi:hypothetical protein
MTSGDRKVPTYGLGLGCRLVITWVHMFTKYLLNNSQFD